jgi:hypothetical protein
MGAVILSPHEQLAIGLRFSAPLQGARLILASIPGLRFASPRATFIASLREARQDIPMIGEENPLCLPRTFPGFPQTIVIPRGILSKQETRAKAGSNRSFDGI